MSQAISLRGRVAALSRSRAADDQELIQARTNLALHRIAGFITERLAGLPPLTADQINLVVAVLHSGGELR